MKLNQVMKLPAIMIGLALMSGSVRAGDAKTAEATAKGEAKAEASGNGSSSVSQSVTVTSDGNQTIKKTVYTENGVTKTKVEVTDANGKTKIIEGDDDGKPGAKPDEEAAKEGRVWIGLKVRKASQALKSQIGLKNNEGLVVEVVAPKGPASKAGIIVDDLILELDEKPMASPEALEAEIQKHKEGDIVEVLVMREGQRKKIEAILERRPADQKEEAEEKPKGGNNTGDQKDPFDVMLTDPNVPESFKKTVREMQKRQEEFKKKQK
jgi:membrane-associated protease RseP (regulator of RpoE activity)